MRRRPQSFALLVPLPGKREDLLAPEDRPVFPTESGSPVLFAWRLLLGPSITDFADLSSQTLTILSH